MYQHILVPVDGSDTALLALQHAKVMAKAFQCTVTALYVIVMDLYPLTGVGTDLAYGQAQYVNDACEQARQALQRAEQALADSGQQVRTMTVEGAVIQESIGQVVQEQGIDMIIMASNGRTGLEKLLLGSVTSKVLSAVDVPVLVVHKPREQRQADAGGEGQI